MHISMHKTSRHTLLLSLTSEQAFRQKWTEIPPGVTRRESPAAFCDKGGASEGDLIEWGTLQPWKLGGACSTRCEAAQVRMCIQTPPPTPYKKNNKTKRTRHHTKILQNLGQSRLLKNTRKKLLKKIITT